LEGILTKNIDNALTYVREVKAGSVWVNNYMNGGVQMPFGGYKLSGYGREGGPEGLNPFCEIKSVVIDLPNL
jgi:acyl-CoA reductase-like NAD-dependent aldehyde dehydrogenase